MCPQGEENISQFWLSSGCFCFFWRAVCWPFQSFFQDADEQHTGEPTMCYKSPSLEWWPQKRSWAKHNAPTLMWRFMGSSVPPVESGIVCTLEQVEELQNVKRFQLWSLNQSTWCQKCVEHRRKNCSSDNPRHGLNTSVAKWQYDMPFKKIYVDIFLQALGSWIVCTFYK